MGYKRSWAVVISGSLLWGAAASRPLQQHRVPPPQRELTYNHPRKSIPVTPFWIPSHSRRISTDQEFLRSGKNRKLRREDEGDEVLWSIQADASIENPEAVLQDIRDARIPMARPRFRRIEEGFSEADSKSPGFVNTNTDPNRFSNDTNSVDFNVTAETVYNVSQTVTESTGNTTNDTSTVVFTTSQEWNKTDGNESKIFQPIRIRAFLLESAGGGQYLQALERDSLMQDIVRPALLAWSAALRVTPVQGNLTVDKSQLLDGATCGPGRDSGLPSIAVPSSHLTTGIPDTDMVVYISLAFTSSAVDLSNNSSSEMLQYTNVTNSDTIPPKGDDIASQADTVQGVQEGAGAGAGSNFTTDMNLGNNSSRLTCSGDFIAASSFCSTDQYDRPTAAILHLCIDDAFFNKDSLELAIMVVMHELGHALGFNQVSLAHFRKPDGTPITPRQSDGSIPETEIECTGPREGRRWGKVVLPSSDILQFRDVRGGIRAAEVVTPSVAQVARNFFDCQELPGAELESGEFLPLSTNVGDVSCIGDHWERRLFKTDLMNPIVSGLSFSLRFSTITLAYFADSGWYQVDLTRASVISSWGRGAGCAFVEKPCIEDDGQVPPTYAQFFCNQVPTYDDSGYANELNGCTPDLTRKAVCSLGEYKGELPPEYQYFHHTLGSNIGGNDPFMDYCPVYAGFSNGLCSDANNDALMRVNSLEKFGYRNSRCLAATVASLKTGLCLPIACVLDDRTLRIEIDGVWETCSAKNHVLTTQEGVEIMCPDPIAVCPTFYCDRDCLGTNMTCDFATGKCVCEEGVACNTLFNSTHPNPVFYGPPPTEDSLPDPDSPLSDYYVRNLKEGPPEFVQEGWPLALVGFTFVTMVAVAMFLFRSGRVHCGPFVNTPDPGDDGQGNVLINRNKDKMIATVLVDMRINDPNLRDPLDHRASETDLSLTDTEGEATHVTNLSLEAHDVTGFGVDSNEATVDPLAPPCAIRRRIHQDHSRS